MSIGLLSAALRAVAPKATSFRLALLFAAYLATNIGAFGAGMLGTFITQTVGGSATQFAFASITALTFLLSLPLTILSFLSPPEDAEEPAVGAAALPIAFITAGVGAAAWIAWGLATDLQWGMFEGISAEASWIFSINPVVVSVASLVCLVAALGIAMSEIQLPPLMVAGVGVLVLAASLALSPAALPFGTVGFVALQGLAAVAEPLAFVGLYVAATLGLSWRIAPAAIAILQIGLAMGSLLGNALPAMVELSAWGAAAGGLVLGLIGAGVLAAAWPVKRLLDAEQTA